MNDVTTSIRTIILNLNSDPIKSVNFEEFSKKHNITIRESYIGVDDKGNEILGACKTKGLKKLIIISPNIENSFRKRFTIAHEIGHLYLHHGNIACVATDFNFLNDKQIRETEANLFAAELLLPYTQCLEALRRNDISFSVIEAAARQYKVSLSATAIRFVRIDSGMSAVIAHDGNRIQWVVKSPECRNDFTTVIVPCSLYQKAKGSTSSIKETVDPSTWFDGVVDGWICEVETRYFKNLNSYITILNTYEQ